MHLHWDSVENHSFLNPRFSGEQTRDLLDLLGVFSNEFQRHLFLLSSGTTSQSHHDLKWIALSKEAFLASAASVNQHLESGPWDRWLHPLPDFHVGGLSIWARSFLSGAQVHRLEGLWNAESFVKQVQTLEVTLSSLVPTQIFDLVRGNFKAPQSIRAILVGGGALAPILFQQALALGWPLLPTYGMTETCSQIATTPLFRPQSFDSNCSPEFRVLPHLELRVGEEGLLEVKGQSLLSAVIFRGKEGKPLFVDPKRDGWFQTQDRGRVKGKVLEVLGRIGDFIKIGGESVEMGRLRDIFEKVKIQLEIKADVALIPFPDERLGYVIQGVAEAHLTENEAALLTEKFNVQVLAFEKIRKWHRIAVLPRTSLGKLIYSECIKACSR